MTTAADVQRLFLQSAISRRIIPEKLAKTLWLKCIEAVNTANPELRLQTPDQRAIKAEWEGFIAQVNQTLDPLDLEFRHIFDEDNGRIIYALANRKGDEIAQAATEYSPAEIAYFKGIVEQIMLAPRESYSISSFLAIREPTALKINISKSQAEVVLSSFVARGWLMRSNRGRYSLSPRTLLELQTYLRATYPDEIIECTSCMEMVTRGRACYTRACKARFHNHCLAKYLTTPRKVCPACDASWAAPDNEKLVPVGEEAVQDGQELRRTRRQADDDEEEADEEAEEEVDYDNEDPASQPGPSQLQTGAQKRRRTTRAAVVESDDNAEEEQAESSQPTQAKRRSSRR